MIRKHSATLVLPVRRPAKGMAAASPLKAVYLLTAHVERAGNIASSKRFYRRGNNFKIGRDLITILLP